MEQLMRKMGVVVMGLLWGGCVVDVDRNPGVALQSSSGSTSGVSQDNRSSSGGCTGFGPICVQGSPGGDCGDGGRQAICTNGNWTCPAGFIPNDQCTCTGPQCFSGSGSSSRHQSLSGYDACVATCSVGCGINLCDSQGNRYCNECTANCANVHFLSECEASSSGGSSSSRNNVEACVAACGLSCPPQPFCDSTGQFYCNQCVAGCYGVTEELRLCSAGVDAGLPPFDAGVPAFDGGSESCIAACGFGCANLCDSRGNRFCSECTAACDGVTEPLHLCTEGPLDAGVPAFDGGVPDPRCPVAAPTSFTACNADPDNFFVCEYGEASCAGGTSIQRNTCACYDGTAGPGEWRCLAENVCSCETACGVGCAAPEFQICNAQGDRFCSTCMAECLDPSGASSHHACGLGGVDAGVGPGG